MLNGMVMGGGSSVVTQRVALGTGFNSSHILRM